MKTLAVYAAGVLTGILVAYIFVKLNYETCEEDEVKAVENLKEDILGIKSPAKSMMEGTTDFDLSKAVNDDLFKGKIEEEFEKSIVKPAIFQIDEDEFYDPMTYDDGEYDKVSIKYDLDDDIFIDEDETMISDLSVFGGLEKSYAFYSCYDVFYIRNDILKIDYEIVKDRDFEFNRSGNDESHVDRRRD